MLQVIGLSLALTLAPGRSYALVGDNIGDLRKMYDYDPKVPLDAKEKLLYERGGVKVFDLTYVSPKGARVTAYLVVPTTKGPHAGLVFGHWGPGNRTEFLPEATLYARAGAVCLLVDYPWVRPSPWRKKQDSDHPHSCAFTEFGDLAHNLTGWLAAVGAVDSNMPIRDARRSSMSQADTVIPPRAHRSR